MMLDRILSIEVEVNQREEVEMWRIRRQGKCVKPLTHRLGGERLKGGE